MFLTPPSTQAAGDRPAGVGVHRFGSVEVRPGERQVRVDGVPVPLRSRALDVLLALIERRDRIVPRAELYAAVWGDRVVEDGNLDVQIHAIRKALGRDALVTVPGRGYRFALDGSLSSSTTAERESRPCSAPTPPTMLFGRDADLLELDGLLESKRLVTIVGAGGIGKTAVASVIASRRRSLYRHGLAWVDASPLRDATLLLDAVVHELDLVGRRGTEALRTLGHALAERQVLLVIDNAEHLLTAVAELANGILDRAPGVRIIVTSQATLRVDGECVFRLDPLACPPARANVADALTHGSVALFVEEVRATHRSFTLDEHNVRSVVSLCRHLDGLPLAIKLAAARVPLFGVRGLRIRLASRLVLIGGGPRNAPTRQQTLRAAMDWSHSLLSHDEQSVYRRLAVFVGTFDLESAMAVGGANDLDADRVIDALAGLVDRSLVVASPSDPVRYRLLESARDYALEKLAEDVEDESTARRNHAAAAVARMNRLYEQSWSAPEQDLLPAFAEQLEDTRSAVAWAIRSDAGAAVEALGSTMHFQVVLGRLHEVGQLCTRVDRLADGLPASAVTARYWYWRAQCCAGLNHHAMHRFAAKAVACYQELGDPEGLGLALAALLGSGQVPRKKQAGLHAELTALTAGVMPNKAKMFVTMDLAMFLHFDGRYVDAAATFERASVLADKSGMRLHETINIALSCAAHYAAGNVADPLMRCKQVAEAERQRRYGFATFPLGFAALGQMLSGRPADARASLDKVFGTSGGVALLGFHLYAIAFVLLAMAEQRWRAAACLLGLADQVSRRQGLTVLPPATIDDLRKDLVEALGADRYRTLAAAGRAMTTKEIGEVTLAVDDVPD